MTAENTEMNNSRMEFLNETHGHLVNICIQAMIWYSVSLISHVPFPTPAAIHNPAQSVRCGRSNCWALWRCLCSISSWPYRRRVAASDKATSSSTPPVTWTPAWWARLPFCRRRIAPSLALRRSLARRSIFRPILASAASSYVSSRPLTNTTLPTTSKWACSLTTTVRYCASSPHDIIDPHVRAV